MVVLATVGVGCSRNGAWLLISLPGDFSGQVQINMGVPGAPALQREGKNYRVTVPPDGRVVTSTIVEVAGPKFENVDAGRVWGYSRSVFRTGDHLPVGGNIDFFIGTKEQYESAEAKKHKSGLHSPSGAVAWDRS